MGSDSARHIKNLNSSTYNISKMSLLIAGVVVLLLAVSTVYIY